MIRVVGAPQHGPQLDGGEHRAERRVHLEKLVDAHQAPGETSLIGDHRPPNPGAVETGKPLHNPGQQFEP